jgi:tyrosine-specific transport protein
MNSKLLGGILLVVGTSIGAGMLALPVATAELGFWASTLLLVSCWAIMTLCALLFLEVNLWLPPNSNLISMAGLTLGRWGQAVTWAVYLLLFYSILCAYIAGGGDLFDYLFRAMGLHFGYMTSAILFTVALGVVVYMGIRSVDYVNRGLMVGKMGALVLLVLFIVPFVTGNNLGNGEFKHIVSPSGIMIAIVSFVSAMIIPSLRTYFDGDIKTLRKAIVLGTLIPLICYIAWELAILGVVPLDGDHSMRQMLHSSSSNSDLIVALSALLQKNVITSLAKFFISICMATSFLSIALSLSDFLSDGLKITKKGFGSVVIYSATFLPPILVVLFYPDAFIRGLQYAGISCFVLMIMLPALMAWRGRYSAGLVQAGSYQVGGGKLLLITLIIFSAIMIVFGLKGVI